MVVFSSEAGTPCEYALSNQCPKSIWPSQINVKLKAPKVQTIDLLATGKIQVHGCEVVSVHRCYIGSFKTCSFKTFNTEVFPLYTSDFH